MKFMSRNKWETAICLHTTSDGKALGPKPTIHKGIIVQKGPNAKITCFYTRSVALSPGRAPYVLMASLYKKAFDVTTCSKDPLIGARPRSVMFTVAVLRFGLSLPLATTSLTFELAVRLLYCRLAVIVRKLLNLSQTRPSRSLPLGTKCRAYSKGQNGDVLPHCRKRQH